MPDTGKPFHLLFQEHLNAGWRNGVRTGRKWKHEDFAAQVCTGTRTLTNWKNGSRTPEKPECDRIMDLLYSDGCAEKAVLANAWGKAVAGRGAPGRLPKSAPDLAKPLPPSPPPGPVCNNDRAELELRRFNNAIRGEAVPLVVTVDIGRINVYVPEQDGQPAISARFAIEKAELAATASGLRRIVGSELGIADNPHPHVAFAKNWYVTVPKATDGLPGGNVLDAAVLRRYDVGDRPDYAVQVDLYCRDTDLVSPEGPAVAGISEKQRATLLRTMQRDEADRDGKILLGRVGLSGETGS